MESDPSKEIDVAYNRRINLSFSNTSHESTTRAIGGLQKYRDIYHDNRRLLKHRAKNCECHVCYREIHKLPPAETHEEYVSTIKSKVTEREIKRAKKKAKRDVKAGKQSTIQDYFRYN